MNNDFLWVEKYRPKTIEECILPDNIKTTFQSFLDRGEVPNLLLPVQDVEKPQLQKRYATNSE